MGQYLFPHFILYWFFYIFKDGRINMFYKNGNYNHDNNIGFYHRSTDGKQRFKNLTAKVTYNKYKMKTNDYKKKN